MKVLRNWSSSGSIAALDINLDEAVFIEYRVDESRNLSGASLRMSNGEVFAVDAATAKSIMLIIGDDDAARTFLKSPQLAAAPPLPIEKRNATEWTPGTMMAIALFVIAACFFALSKIWPAQ